MENKKVKNATPTVVDGMEYRSKLEARFAQLLTEAHIPFEYETQRWEIVPKQKYRGETLRAVTYTPDFLVFNHAVEIKGFKNDVYPLKKKLIVKFLTDTNSEYIFHEIKTVGEMKEFIKSIQHE